MKFSFLSSMISRKLALQDFCNCPSFVICNCNFYDSAFCLLLMQFRNFSITNKWTYIYQLKPLNRPFFFCIPRFLLNICKFIQFVTPKILQNKVTYFSYFILLRTSFEFLTASYSVRIGQNVSI